MTKKVLVIGSGGREHALCWKLAQSDKITEIYCAPGNGGTAQERKTANVPIAIFDFEALVGFAREKQIDLTIVGPDNPLADGIVDVFQAAGLKIFGPTKKAAQLESSKAFAKYFMQTYKLPTAQFEVFGSHDEALSFCMANEWARVIKVDGLALGKGVYVCDTLLECETALTDIFKFKRFGDSGAKVVIEERLEGPEISLMVLSDGKTLAPMASSQDYKRRFEDNQGPNTGGMGSFSPAPLYESLIPKIEETILKPLAKGLQESEIGFQGVLYVGLLIQNGEPYVLEFNARFGDPEAQCLLPRLESDLYTLFESCTNGTLHQQTMRWTEQSCVCTVLVAETYPEKSLKDVPITINETPSDIMVFHAGTKYDEEGILVTNGGRILNIVGMADTLERASRKVYDVIEEIEFEGMTCRQDIAKDVAACPSK